MAKASFKKTALIYLAGLGVTWLLLPVVWGTIGGALCGSMVVQSKTLQNEMKAILENSGVKADNVTKRESHDPKWLAKLSPEARGRLQALVERDAARKINWFAATIFTSALVFAVVGTFCGLVTRRFWFVGIIPAMTFLGSNPLITFAHARQLSLVHKVTVVAAQFATCYVFAYLGALLGRRRDRRRSPGTSTGGNCPSCQ